MKQFLSIICIICVFTNVKAQNLVSNGDFEYMDRCPEGEGDLHPTQYWISANQATPDYFNSCVEDNLGTIDVPKNYQGIMEARSGEGYAGIYVLKIHKGMDWREYLHAALKEPMKLQTSYCIQFWVSLSDNSKFAISGLGVTMTRNQLKYIKSHSITEHVPQVVNLEKRFLMNKEWTKVCGIYKSAGGEQYITIGNFRKTVATNKITLGMLDKSDELNYCYYYIDDVSVEAIESKEDCGCNLVD